MDSSTSVRTTVTALRLGARAAVPVHHDDYRVFHSPLQDFLTELSRSDLSIPVRTPGRGGTVDLDAPWT